MPYLDPNQLDPTQQQNQTATSAQNSNNVGVAPATAGGVSSSAGPGVSAAGTSYSAAAPTSGSSQTGFQNLQSYLDANSGNNMAGQVAGKISDEANTANSGLASSQQQFQGAVDENTVSADPSNVQSVLSNPTGADQSATQRFQQQLNASYGGPANASQYAPFAGAQSQAKDAYQRAQSAQTAEGRQSLLKDYFGTPTYTSGEKSLDSALIGNDKSGVLSDVQSQVQNLPAQFQSAGQALNQYAQRGAGTTAAARESARNALGVDDAGNLLRTDPTTGKTLGSDAYGNQLHYGGTYGNGIGSIEDAATTSASGGVANAPAKISAAQNALSSANLSSLTPDQRAALGDVSNFSGNLYNLPLSQYLSATPSSSFTPGSVISKDQQARLAALDQISNRQNTFAPDATLAGTANPNAPYTFDNAGFQTGLATQKTQAQAQMDKLKGAVDVDVSEAAQNHPATGGGGIADPNELYGRYTGDVNAYNTYLQNNDASTDLSTGKITLPQLMQLLSQNQFQVPGVIPDGTSVAVG